MLCSHVLLPMLAHGSLLIYAPDCVLLKAWAARGALGPPRQLLGAARDVFAGPAHVPRSGSHVPWPVQDVSPGQAVTEAVA